MNPFAKKAETHLFFVVGEESRPPLAAERVQRRRYQSVIRPMLTVSVVLSAGLVLPGQAQNPIAPTAPLGAPTNIGAVTTTNVVLNGVNVLIVAFDDLSFVAPMVPAPSLAPVTLPAAENAEIALPAAPLPLPDAPALDAPVIEDAPQPRRAPIAPVAPPTVVPPAIAPAIAPASLPLDSRAFWRALAQQKPKKETKAEIKVRQKAEAKARKDAIFQMAPEPMRDLRPNAAQNAPLPSPDNTNNSSAISGDNVLEAGEENTISPFALDSTTAQIGAPRPPGRAQLAAAPLRRALLRAGYADVLTTSPDANAILRAVNNRRLSERVVEELRAATAQLAGEAISKTPSPTTVSELALPGTPTKAQAMAYRAAARVGQALGYRAVIAMGVLPQNAQDGKAATYALAVVDAMNEVGDTVVFDEQGKDDNALNEAAALTGGALVAKTLNTFPEITQSDKVARANNYMKQARAAFEKSDYAAAQDALNQALVFDPNRAEARLMLADVIQNTDPAAAGKAYQNALRLDGGDGETWTKAAIAFTIGPNPDWPRALEAGRKALSLNFDSSALRQAMATAQLGRAQLFRAAERLDSADDAELDARRHLDRALELAPDDPGVTRLMMRQFVQQGRYREAVRALDRLALQYPNDADLQTQYATSLLEVGGREEDAFVAWARVWKLSGKSAAPVDASRYRRLAEGFDQRLAGVGKRAAQLSAGVSAGTTAREAALLQMTRFKEDMSQAIGAIKVMQPNFDGQRGTVHNSRIFAADLMSQTIEAHLIYLETGQELYRSRANELHRQAIVILNAARTAR